LKVLLLYLGISVRLWCVKLLQFIGHVCKNGSIIQENDVLLTSRAYIVRF